MRSKNKFEKNLKLPLKYSRPRPIYIASKQDNNCFLQNRMEFEAERTAAQKTVTNKSNCSMEAALNSRRKNIMVVQHNMTAANANRMLGITTGAQAKSSEK